MSSKDELSLGEKIAARRKAKGWDQPGLGEKINARSETISRWETGKSMPDKPCLLYTSDAADD